MDNHARVITARLSRQIPPQKELFQECHVCLHDNASSDGVDQDERMTNSRQLTRRHILCVITMVLSASLTFVLTGIVVPGIDGLGRSMAAATGVSVAVWCDTNSYRRGNGSLALAIALVVVFWVVPGLVLLTSYTD